MAHTMEFTPECVSEINKKPIVMYRNHNEGRPRAFLSGWMHHYEHTDVALRALLDSASGPASISAYAPILDGLDMYVIPDINPCNYIGLNRTLDVSDMPWEYRFLDALEPFDLAVDLHGDVDKHEFYLYERRAPGLPSMGRPVLKRMRRSGFGTDMRVQPLDKDEHTMEEYHWKKGTLWSITTEGPLGSSRRKYNLANAAALIFILEEFHKKVAEGALLPAAQRT